MYVVFLRTQIGKAQFVGATDLWIKGVLVLSKKLGDPECVRACAYTRRLGPLGRTDTWFQRQRTDETILGIRVEKLLTWWIVH